MAAEEVPLTESSFGSVWQQYINQLDTQGKMSLSVIYKDAKWQIANESEIELTLTSQHEREMFDEDRINIMPFLRSQLKHFKLDISVKINQGAQVKRAFTAEDKFKLMAEKNPALIELRNTLGLELEY